MKDNPFVKVAPTGFCAYLLEQTPTTLKMRRTSQPRDVPYCDCFYIEEEYLCTMPEGCTTSSILRVTMTVIWLKSTMMKGIIASNAQKESKTFWNAYADYVKKNGNIWKEKKKDIKLNHGIEKAIFKVQQKEDQASTDDVAAKPTLENLFGMLPLVKDKIENFDRTQLNFGNVKKQMIVNR